MNLKWMILFGVALVNIGLAFLVYKNNPTSATNKIFTALSFATTAWLPVIYLSIEPFFSQQSLLFTRLSVFFAVPQSVLLFLLAYTMPSPVFNLRKTTLFLIAAASFCLMLLTLSSLVFREVQFVGGVTRPIPGIGFPFFAIFTAAFSFYAIYTLIRKTWISKGIQKDQFAFVTMGIVLLLVLIIGTIMIPVMLFQYDRLIIFTPFYVFIFLGLTAYAIVRHRFLDIRVLLARTLSFALLIGLVAFVYALLLFSGAERLFKISISTSLFITIFGFTVLVMLTFQPLLNSLRFLTNRIFFAGHYDRERLLSNLTHLMTSTIDLDEMTSGILKILVREMQLTKATFLIVNKHIITDLKGIGYKGKEREFKDLEVLFHTKEQEEVFVFENLAEDELKASFRTLDVSVAIPIRVEKEEVAILVLSSKLNGEAYYETDIDLLNVFASEAGIAIQNAKAYAEIKKFSKELEWRVEERTKELRASQKSELAKAQAVAKLKDEFVFVAAHELRTPVTVIKGFLELVSEAKANFPKDVRDHLSAIASASDNLGQLVNDLLEIARSDADSMKVETSPVDIMPVVKTLVEEVEQLAEKKHVTIEFGHTAKIPMVMGDIGRIKEVLLNLLSNAIKYNRPNGNIEISVIPQTEYVIVEVQDTGYGIPKEQQKRIFEKFFRVANKDTQEVIGTGLGLFITKMLVEKMGGQMTFSSVEGKGSTFSFSLPLSTGQR